MSSLQFVVHRHLLAKASELLTTAENKASAAADVIATKTVEAKDATVAAAHTAASTVQGIIGSFFVSIENLCFNSRKNQRSG